MIFGSRVDGVALVAGQVMLVAIGLLVLGLFPPAVGRMLLVPVTDRGRAHILSHALTAGAALVGRGPIDGSYVVYGERSRIAPTLYDDGVMALAGSAPLCGTAS
ncbi:hypothetical protein ASE75_11690 [Sphingomonas sp. Leaf17]|nr:hypothetical protein ASE75_11690 [Sphingomonas sp. Leaf17]